MTSPHTLVSVMSSGLHGSALHGVGDYPRVWMQGKASALEDIPEASWLPCNNLGFLTILWFDWAILHIVLPASTPQGGLQGASRHMRMAGRWYSSLVSLFLHGALVPSWGPTLRTSSHSRDLPQAPPPKTIMLDIRASTYETGGRHKHSVHSRPQYLFDEEMKENPQIGLTVLIKNHGKK